MKLFTAAAAAVALAAIITVSHVLGGGAHAVYSQIECADLNGDHRLNGGDAAQPGRLPDFNGDGRHDGADAAFVRGVDLTLDPVAQQAACAHDQPDRGPEWAVFSPGTRGLTCDSGRPAVLILGIGGGVTNLEQGDAAGVRRTIEDLRSAFQKQHVATLTVLSGQAINPATSGDTAMEQWATHATRVFLDGYPCLRVAVIGHSHGAITADVLASKLERDYGNRFVEVVDLDRVEMLYNGDTRDWPVRIPVFNIYETRSGGLSGKPHVASNVTNWDATGELAPKNGDQGGPLVPVNHTTVDNSQSVEARIIADVLRHWYGQ